MERKDIKEILLDLGVEEKYLNMPSIMERIYMELHTYKTKDDIERSITVNESGITIINTKDKEIVFGNFQDQYPETQNPTTFIEISEKTPLGKVEPEAARFFINQYGMDEEYMSPVFRDSMVAIMFDFGFARRNRDVKNREIVNRVVRIGEIVNGESIYEDKGDYDIRRNRGIWEENKQFLTTHYPITRQWFEEKERPKTTEELEAEIAELKQENKELREIAEEKNQLESKVRRLQTMLKTTLDFCTEVKQSRVGKIFFRDKIKQLPSSSVISSDLDER